MSDNPPTLDYASPEPRERPAWADRFVRWMFWTLIALNAAGPFIMDQRLWQKVQYINPVGLAAMCIALRVQHHRQRRRTPGSRKSLPRGTIRHNEPPAHEERGERIVPGEGRHRVPGTVRGLLRVIFRFCSTRCPRCKEPLVVKIWVMGKHHPSSKVWKCVSCGVYYLDYDDGLRELTSGDPLAEAHRIVHASEYKPYPYCHECGYNLTGNVTGICSECGTPIFDERALL